MEAFNLEILEIPFQLQFSNSLLLPLNRSLHPFLVSELVEKKHPTIITIIDKSFDGLDSSQHFTKQENPGQRSKVPWLNLQDSFTEALGFL